MTKPKYRRGSVSRRSPRTAAVVRHDAANKPITTWESLRLAYPWPDEMPRERTTARRGSAEVLSPAAQVYLSSSIGNDCLFLDLGAGDGRAARFVLDQNQQRTTVICTDDWPLSEEEDPRLSFFRRCWLNKYQRSIVGIRCQTLAAVNGLGRRGVQPKLICVRPGDENCLPTDCYCKACLLLSAIDSAMERATIVGVNWAHRRVLSAAVDVAKIVGRRIRVSDSSWIMYPNDRDRMLSSVEPED